MVTGTMVSWQAMIAVALCLSATGRQAVSTQPAVQQADGRAPVIVHVGGRDLQGLVDDVPDHSVLICNRNRPLVLSSPLVIRKPLTVRGLNAQLPAGLGRTPLVVVRAKGVSITGFELRGNADTVPQEDRCALMCIHAGGFAVEKGCFYDSSKDGVMIESQGTAQDIVGGVVRDVVGRGVLRDVVSISGGTHGGTIRNVLVENARAYGSSKRGTVEVSDGTDNITVRKVYAQECTYAVDVSDHGQRGQDNRNILLEDICAVKCRHAVTVRLMPDSVNRNSDLTIRDVTAERCIYPVRIRDADRVLLDGVRVLDHGAVDDPVVVVGCDGITIRDLVVMNAANAGPALQIIDSNHVIVDGLLLCGDTTSVTHAVEYMVSAGKACHGLCIRNVMAPGIRKAGILLSAAKDGGTLTDFIISGNLAHVVSEIATINGIIRDNPCVSE